MSGYVFYGFAVSFVSLWQMRVPFVDGLPERDIVFMPIESHPVYGHSTSDVNAHTLGFINSDGSGYVVFRFAIPGGSLDMIGRRRTTYMADVPVWGEQVVFFHIRDSGPNIRAIDDDGKLLGDNCYLVSYGNGLDKSDHVFGLVNKDAPVWELFKDQMKEDETLWVRISLQDCKISGYFRLPVGLDDVHPTVVGETATGEIVSAHSVSNHQDYILITDILDGTYYSLPGYFPSLSDDGKRLAYYDYDNNLVVRDIETQQERKLLSIIHDPVNGIFHPSSPGWSPDGKWLVFSTDGGKIYTLNIETLEKSFLVDGWYHDWK